MHIEDFTPEERSALLECVAAVRALAVFAEPDFEVVFGSSRSDVEDVLEAYPNWDLYDESANSYDASGDVVRSALSWLIGGSEEEKSAMGTCLTFDPGLGPRLLEKLDAGGHGSKGTAHKTRSGGS